MRQVSEPVELPAVIGFGAVTAGEPVVPPVGEPAVPLARGRGRVYHIDMKQEQVIM